jgi:hypothetical protein
MEKKPVRTMILTLALLTLTAVACEKQPTTRVSQAMPPLKPGMKLFLDVHHFGPGKVSAEDVAGAHQKDLAVGPKHNVTYLSYWLDEKSGTVTCLSEAPNAEAALATHQEAHGLMPDSIAEVSDGRSPVTAR